MGFWGAVEETVVDGSAGAVGMVPGGDFVAAGIHGADALVHGAIGGIESIAGAEGADEHYGNFAREGVSAGAAAAAGFVPGAGQIVAGLDLAQAAGNAVVAGANAVEWGMSGAAHDGDVRTTGERINQSVAHPTQSNPINEGWGGW